MIVRELLVKLGFKLDGTFGKVQTAFDKINRKVQDLDVLLKRWRPFSKLKGGLDVLSSIHGTFAGLGRALVGTISQFQQLEGQLVTLEQSSEKAAAVFVKLQTFAKETPFQLGKIVEAYATLRGAGIEPTIEEMGLMGDMAAGMGQDITDVSAAFAKASMGNFELLRERLKVAVTQSKGQVTLAFGDFKKTVKKDGKEIRKALLELSQQKFEKGMERQLQTLAGQFSNLQDNLASFAKEVGEAGLVKGLLALNKFFKELTGSAGEKGLAKAIGRALGDALKLLVRLLEFSRDNVETLTRTFKILLALEVIKWFSGVIAALGRLDTALLKANLKLLVTTGLWLALLILLEDVVGFFQGRESLVGELAEDRNWSSLSGILGQLAQLVINLFDVFSDLLILIITFFEYGIKLGMTFVDVVSDLFVFLMSGGGMFADFIKNTFSGLGDAISKFWDENIAGLPKKMARMIKSMPGGEMALNFVKSSTADAFGMTGIAGELAPAFAPAPRELGMSSSNNNSTRVVNAPITINPSAGMDEEQIGRVAARHVKLQQSEMTRRELRSQYQSVAEDRSGGVT